MGHIQLYMCTPHVNEGRRFGARRSAAFQRDMFHFKCVWAVVDQTTRRPQPESEACLERVAPQSGRGGRQKAVTNSSNENRKS
jgi:hypothetical protein